MHKIVFLILIFLSFPTFLLAEKKKVYIRREEGALPIKDTYVNTGIVFLSIFEYPKFDLRQMEAILIGLQDRTYSLNSKHTSFGIESPTDYKSVLQIASITQDLTIHT
ncbi:hypothetical protein LEP1GSC088_0922 [Leptospira interrogans str. L1207]|nr:hypothetical protein LEP1GSC088_0922 [Leptospira interrogans str. L1207]